MKKILIISKQEKLFIMGLNLSDAQTRMGKHGGDRWNDMDKTEKSLYLILREADALEYSWAFWVSVV